MTIVRCGTPVLALLIAVATPMSATQAAEGWPARVQATYDVDFNGLNVGTFDFVSSQDGANYSLSGTGKLSLLLGAFKWKGDTQAAGRIAADGPKPQSFNFTFGGTSKAGSTRLSYTADTVTSVLHDPPAKIREGVIPVQAQHLKAVLDPLSAILALTKGTTGNPCQRRIPVYDGKARFDLLLSPRGQVQLSEKRPSGQPGTGYVCRVKYVPIAGHKADEETKYMSGSDGIEIVLRPIPSANIFVPYKITIPTVAGPATLTSRTVSITTAGQQQIALSH
jgi:Protein of unknown function (DUF3108)